MTEDVSRETPPLVDKLFPRAAVRLSAYAELLATEGTLRGLIGPREVPRLWDRHLLNCAVVERLIPEESLVADIGTGAGLPGIPLAVLNPERQVTLIDANGKKTRFLREAVRTLKLGNVRIEACRVEDARGEFDTVTARAFASLGDMLHSAGHLLAPDDILLALKGQLQRDEISALPEGFAIGDVHALSVPGLAAARHAVIIRRTQAVRHGHAA